MGYREYCEEHWREIRISNKEVIAARMGQKKPDLLKIAGKECTVVRGWERSACGDYWTAWVDAPTPEGLLL